jgi:predicted SAM-dependent methyltransferase
MLPYIAYQREMCEKCPRPILNVGCKEDPARLGTDFNATNVDCCDFDIQEGINLYSVPNFQVASILDLPFPDQSFGTIVLGDVLEHGTYDLSLVGLKECWRVLMDNGWLVCTVPQDARPKELNHAPEHLVTYPGGFTSYHHYWSDEDISRLFKEAGVEVDPTKTRRLRYVALDWSGGQGWGYGFVLKKKARS